MVKGGEAGGWTARLALASGGKHVKDPHLTLVGVTARALR